MAETCYTAPKLFYNAGRLIEAYRRALLPLCKETGLPPMAVDILMFLANNPKNAVAKDICRYRGFKPGIVSVHIERMVRGGLLRREAVQGDRRKNKLVISDAAGPIIDRGLSLQNDFARELLAGVDESDFEAFRRVLTVMDKNIDGIRNTGLCTTGY